MSQVELSVVLEQIVRRRREVDDPDLERLPDDAESPNVADVYEVLNYLSAHTSVPEWVLRADVCDALRLNNYLWWHERRRELTWLRAGVQRGLLLSQVGAAVGVGKQGLRDRIDRLDALLRYDRPDEQLSREARAAARSTSSPSDVHRSWLDAHTEELVDLAEAMDQAAEQHGLSGSQREWIDELIADARHRAFSSSSLAVLGLAADELKTAPGIAALTGPRPHAVHASIARADELRSAYASLRVAH